MENEENEETKTNLYRGTRKRDVLMKRGIQERRCIGSLRLFCHQQSGGTYGASSFSSIFRLCLLVLAPAGSVTGGAIQDRAV